MKTKTRIVSILFIALFIFSTEAYSQKTGSRFSIFGGVNTSAMIEDYTVPASAYDFGYQFGASIRTNKLVFVGIGLAYGKQSSEINLVTDTISFEYEIDHIAYSNIYVPLELGFRIINTKPLKFNIFGGVNLGYINELTSDNYTQYDFSDINNLSVSLSAGASIGFSIINFEIQYKSAVTELIDIGGSRFNTFEINARLEF